MSKLLITTMEIHKVSCIVTALWEEGRILQIHLYPKEKKDILGNIYVGKVENIAENIQAAFVRIQDQTICYLPLSDLAYPIYTVPKKDQKLHVGDELLVQIHREVIKHKAPCVTTKLSFTGKYLVLTTEKGKFGVSSKLDKETRKRLKEWLIPELSDAFSMIVRTNAQDASREELLEELNYLKTRMEYVLQYGPSRVSGSLVEETAPGYLLDIRDMYHHDLEAIVTDSDLLYPVIKNYLHRYQPDDESLLQLYEDKLLPLIKLYRLETSLDTACREKVWLPSGGSLIIQQTEAFVAIDVNTGKYNGKKKAEETFRKINLEAAQEIACQIRLRNLSGMILIDFINLSDPDHEKELLHVLQKHLKKDPVKANVIDMTALKIIEVTRKKVRKSLEEELQGLQ